jgi:hypothetical protein
MRHVLALALFCGCLWAAPADAGSPLTKRNNDASLRKPHAVGPPPYQRSHPYRINRGRHQDEKPAAD